MEDADSVGHALVALEDHDRLRLEVVAKEYELVLNLIVRVAYALLLCKVVGKLLLAVDLPVLHHEELAKFRFELILSHRLVVVLPEYLDQFGFCAEERVNFLVKMLPHGLRLKFREDDGA